MPLSLDGTGSIIGISTVSVSDDLTHVGDTNTKISFPANDTITAETAGTERLRITSTGEVKIMNTSGTVGLYFQSSSGAVSNFRAIGTNNQSLGYFFGNSEKVRFSSDGKVGINSTSPSSTLDVVGGYQALGLYRNDYTGNSGAGIELYFGRAKADGSLFNCATVSAVGSDNTGQASQLRFSVLDSGSMSEKLRIDTNGKLILGTEYVNAANANANISLFLSGTRSGSYGGQTTNAIIFDNQTAAVDAGGSITLAGYSGSQAIAKALIRGGNEGSASTQAGYFAVFIRPASGGLTEKLRVTSGGLLQLNNDSAKIQLGASQDLSIYHDGSSNRIIAANADLIVQSNNYNIRSENGSSTYLNIDSSGRLLTGGATASQGSTNADDLQIGANNQSNQTGITLGSASASSIRFADAGDDTAGAVYYHHSDNSLRFTAGGTERFRVENDPGIVVQNFTSGDGDNNAAVALQEDYNAWGIIFRNDWIAQASGWGTFWAGSAGARYRRVSNDTNPNEYVFVGSGNKRFTFELNNGAYYSDGSVNGNNYDYAEYFEWEDGNPSNEDRRGYSVFVNSNGKIEKATDSTNTSDIIGVISGTAMILGDGAVYDWQGKWKVDEWGTVITEDVKQVTWRGEDGKRHSYDEDKIPSGLTAPSDATYRQHSRRILNPDYDETKVYVPRDKRQEWDPVGLIGKVRVRDDSPKNPNWKFIKTVNGKKLWLIR